MQDKCKIVYTYFLAPDGKINNIPPKEKEHKEKLLKDIRKFYPSFEGPYSFYRNGPEVDREYREVKEVIDIFTKYKTRFRLFKKTIKAIKRML